MKRITKWICAIAASVLIIVFLLLTCIDIVAFDMNFFEKQYRILDRPQATGIEMGELLRVTEELLSYIKDERDDLIIHAVIEGKERQVFNQREIDHMVDVKDLFHTGYTLRLFSLGLIIILLGIIIWSDRKKALLTMSRAWLVTALGVGVLFGILMIIIQGDFTPYWDQFHYIFFDNDLWVLDPRTDIMIQMVPEAFFLNVVNRILMMFISSLLILSLISAYVLRQKTKSRTA